MSREGGTWGGGWVYLKGANSVVVSGLGYRNPWFAADGPVFSSYDNWASQSSHLVRPPFQVLKVFVVWMDG